MTFEKACSLEAPTTEADLIDFTFAEFNRRVTTKATAGTGGWRTRLHTGRMGLEDGVDLAYASLVKNRRLDELGQYGCTCGTACTSVLAHR